MLRKANDRVEKALSTLTSVIFALFILVVLLQVLARNVFTSIPMLWAMDAALLFFVWTVYLGAAIAVRRRTHYVIELFPSEYVRVNGVLDLISDVVVGSGAALLLYGGVTFLPNAFARSSLALGISEGYFFASIPAGGLFMAIFLLEVFIEDMRRLRSAFDSSAPVQE